MDGEARDVLDMPVEDLRLPTRPYYRLKSEGCVTLRDVVAKSAEELMRIPDFGRSSLREVEQRLADFGLALVGRPVGSRWSSAGSVIDRLERIEGLLRTMLARIP